MPESLTPTHLATTTTAVNRGSCSQYSKGGSSAPPRSQRGEICVASRAEIPAAPRHGGGGRADKRRERSTPARKCGGVFVHRPPADPLVAGPPLFFLRGVPMRHPPPPHRRRPPLRGCCCIEHHLRPGQFPETFHLNCSLEEPVERPAPLELASK
jgi:hypothetical protein